MKNGVGFWSLYTLIFKGLVLSPQLSRMERVEQDTPMLDSLILLSIANQG